MMNLGTALVQLFALTYVLILIDANKSPFKELPTSLPRYIVRLNSPFFAGSGTWIRANYAGADGKEAGPHTPNDEGYIEFWWFLKERYVLSISSVNHLEPLKLGGAVDPLASRP